jgi:hypothetical protein
MLALSSAFIDDDEAPPSAWQDTLPPPALQPHDIPLT